MGGIILTIEYNELLAPNTIALLAERTDNKYAMDLFLDAKSHVHLTNCAELLQDIDGVNTPIALRSDARHLSSDHLNDDVPEELSEEFSYFQLNVLNLEND